MRLLRYARNDGKVMRYRELGKTGVKVSEIGFGAWAIGGNTHGNSYGPTKDEDSLAAIAKALDLGCNIFDTADVYGHGHSEELLGQALKKVRPQAVLVTKAGGDFYHPPYRLNFTPEYIGFALEKSLERLQTDYLDLYLLHNPPFSLIQQGRLLEPLERLKTQGKIRFYGISIHDPKEGLMAMQIGKPAALQVVYNWLHREAAEELFPTALAEGVALLAREPLANGFLTGKYTKESAFAPGDIRHNWPDKYRTHVINGVEEFRKQAQGHPLNLAEAALRFCLAQPAISSVLVGCKTPDQVEDNLKASQPVITVQA